jgi:hypothetical protein
VDSGLGRSTNGIGAYGQTDGDGQSGVEGLDASTGGGTGVFGRSVKGTGVYGFGAAYSVYGTDNGESETIGIAASLTNPSNPSPSLQAETKGTGRAVEAFIDNTANSSAAVSVSTNGTGSGVSASIVNAANTHAAIVGSTDGTGSGVYGETTNAAGRGTTGQGANGATGVYGLSDTGTGVYAKSSSGDALQVVGRVAFSLSGLATVAANQTSVTVNLTGVTTPSMILATLQTAAGAITVANAVPASGSFTINLTAAPSSSVKVAWFVLG